MRVVVCCKAVPIDVTPDLLQIVDGDIRCSGSDLYTNELDEYALEEALALKKSHEFETWAITVGPLRSQEVLFTALAKGIDNVLRINGETNRPELVAGALVAELKELQPDLVLVGVQSEDWMGSEVGVYIAEGLGASLGFAVVEITGIGDGQVRIKKEIGGGRQAELTLKLPAVLCVQSGIQPLQYLSAMKRRRVQDTPIKSKGKVEELDIPQNVQDMLKYRAEEISVRDTGAQAEIISGDRSEQAKEIVKIIRKNLTG